MKHPAVLLLFRIFLSYSDFFDFYMKPEILFFEEINLGLVGTRNFYLSQEQMGLSDMVREYPVGFFFRYGQRISCGFSKKRKILSPPIRK